MSLRKYINRIRRLDALIRRKSTGTPEELAERLGISERWLYKFLNELRDEFDCPITYDHYRQSYIYEERGHMVVGFEQLSGNDQREVRGGSNRKLSSLYLFVQ